MIHLFFLIYLLILMLGVGAFAKLLGIRKSDSASFLFDYQIYILFHILFLIASQGAEYVYVNIIGYQPAEFPPFYQFLSSISTQFLILAGSVFFMRLVYHIRSIESPKWIRFTGAAYLILYAAFLVAGSIRFLRSGDLSVFDRIQSLFYHVLYGTLALSSMTLVFHHFDGTVKASGVRMFGILYFLRYALSLAIFHLKFPYGYIGATAIHLAAQIIPFLWLHRYYRKEKFVISAEDPVLLETLVKKFRMTKREKEILQLLIAGKSNKEIEGDLYISFNTVRNHIYRLYHKMGINSRGQLVNLILQMQRSPE